MTWHYGIVAFIALQRLAEVVYSRRNIARLLAEGAALVEEPIYPWLVAVHAAWVLALAIAVPADAAADPFFLGLYLVLLGLRAWVMAALGRFWCTRIVTLPGVRSCGAALTAFCATLITWWSPAKSSWRPSSSAPGTSRLPSRP
jgi:isoprenylcysteine carboxyl methyltransferase (ICMT) family protein YpbQ